MAEKRRDQIEKLVAFQVRGAFAKDSGFHSTGPGNACSQNSAIDTTQPLRLSNSSLEQLTCISVDGPLLPLGLQKSYL